MSRVLAILTLLFAMPALIVRADKLVLVASGGAKDEDGIAAVDAKLNGPFAIDFDKVGNAYIAEMLGLRIRKIDRQGKLTTIAGTGEKGKGPDEGPALKAQFDGPHHLAVSFNGDVYVADTWNNRVRKIDPKTGMMHDHRWHRRERLRRRRRPSGQSKIGRCLLSGI